MFRTFASRPNNPADYNDLYRIVSIQSLYHMQCILVRRSEEPHCYEFHVGVTLTISLIYVCISYLNWSYCNVICFIIELSIKGHYLCSNFEYTSNVNNINRFHYCKCVECVFDWTYCALVTFNFRIMCEGFWAINSEHIGLYKSERSNIIGGNTWQGTNFLGLTLFIHWSGMEVLKLRTVISPLGIFLILLN